MSREKRQLIAELVRTMDRCVLATVDDGQPLTSLMTYLADVERMEFYFLSRRCTKKNANIRRHPRVSLLIDRRDEGLALSIQGLCAPVPEGPEAEAIRARLLAQRPHLASLAAHADTELLKVTGVSAQLLQGIEDAFVTSLGGAEKSA